MRTSELLEGIRERAEARARTEQPHLFDDEDCSDCGKSRLQEFEENREGLKAIEHAGIPRRDAKDVLKAFYQYMTDRMGFAKYARRAFKALEKKAGKFVDWDGMWERLYEIYEDRQ